MHRFYLPPDKSQGDSLLLEGPEAHRAVHVLRLRPGDPAVVLNGAGQEFSCTVTQTGHTSVCLAVQERKTWSPPPCRITLLQAVPKGKTMDFIVQKATELGAARIVPLLTERCVVRLEDGEAQSKRRKWQAVALEAIKQCGAPWLPQIDPPVSPAAFLARGESFDLAFAAALQANALHPRHSFEGFFAAHHRAPRIVCVWVGPEGDFSPGELADIQAAGARPITLGTLVLRSDTAAIYSLSVLSSEAQFAHLIRPIKS